MNACIYISGPISGRPPAAHDFRLADDLLSEKGYSVLNPMHIKDPGIKYTTSEEIWAYYMREAIPMLLQADYVYMLRHWENSRGARMEFNLASELNIPVIFEDQVCGLCSIDPVKDPEYLVVDDDGEDKYV